MPHVMTTSLQMLSPDAVHPPSRTLPPQCRIDPVPDITPEFSKFLYRSVGSSWNWADRLPLTRGEWAETIHRSGSETWVLTVDGAPGGYAELAGTPDGVVEIVYFGLFPEHLGRGFGGPLLAEVTARAWDLHTRCPDIAPVHRVWVHTCSLDGPAALANYLARGFETFAVEEAAQEIVDASTAWWPEA